MHPRPPLGPARVALRRLRRLVRDVRLRGDTYVDPICGGHFATLLPATNGRSNARCPRCTSYERHRVLWLYLEREAGITSERVRVLHMAPEAGLSKRLRSLPNLDYTSADLLDPGSMVKADITDLPFPDASFDVVLCNHVLEHVEDDRAAVAELARVLTPQGRAVMQHPVDLDRAETFEDFSVTDPAERDRLFFQSDHVRIYGRDFEARLRAGGLGVVRRWQYQEALDPQERERFRTVQHPSRDPRRDIEADVIYVCQPV